MSPSSFFRIRAVAKIDVRPPTSLDDLALVGVATCSSLAESIHSLQKSNTEWQWFVVTDVANLDPASRHVCFRVTAPGQVLRYDTKQFFDTLAVSSVGRP